MMSSRMRRLKSPYSSIYICRYKQMTKKYNKPWRTDGHRAKIVLWMICEYIREQCWEEDELGEWRTSVKEYWLMGFQQRIGKKIPKEDEEGLSMEKWAVEKRRYREKLRQKSYDEYISDLKKMRDKNKKK